MKMLIFLHGNPLQGQEFDALLPSLTSLGYQPVLHKRPMSGSNLESLLQSISATAKVSGGGPFGIVAYSWGAYLALSYLKRFPEQVTGVLLINPLVIDPKPLSVPTRFLMATPLLRSLVLKFRSRTLTAGYIHQAFAPNQASQEIRNTLEPYLSQALVWRCAAAYKKLMLTAPLLDLKMEHTLPVRALFGGADEVTSYQQQMAVLQSVSNLEKVVVSEAGHALPWTHGNFILNEIENMF